MQAPESDVGASPAQTKELCSQHGAHIIMRRQDSNTFINQPTIAVQLARRGLRFAEGRVPARAVNVPEPHAFVAAIADDPTRVRRNGKEAGVVDHRCLAGAGADNAELAPVFFVAVAGGNAAAIAAEGDLFGIAWKVGYDSPAGRLDDGMELPGLLDRRHAQHHEIATGRKGGRRERPHLHFGLPLTPLLQVRAADAPNVRLVALHQGHETTAVLTGGVSLE